MAISFERIPGNIRVPLFYVEISGRQASYFAQNQLSLLMGPMLRTGIATPLTPTLVTAFDDAVGLFGPGSYLADMVQSYRKNDSFGELWCIPHEDDQFEFNATLTGVAYADAAAEDAAMTALRLIDDGAFNITINGNDTRVGRIDFTTLGPTANLFNVANAIQANLAQVALCEFSGGQFVISTLDSGPEATISVARPPDAGTGTDISTILLLDTGVAVAGRVGPGTPASKNIAVTGPATGAGTIFLYIGGDRIPVNVTARMTAAQMVQAAAETVNADPFCLVTAAPLATDPTTIVFAAKQNGVIGNDIDISVNLRGVAGGEFLPPGVSVATSLKTPGAGVPPVDAMIAAMADDEYDFIGTPYADTASLDAYDELMNDLSGRWSWDRQIYGGVFTAKQGTAQQLVDFGRGSATAGTYGRNGPHVHVLGYAANPTPPWRRAAALTAQAASGLRLDPARPLQTLPLIGVLAPPRGTGFKVTDKNTLLYSGISVEMADLGGQVRIQRCISTYQRNAWGQTDPSWLDVQTSYTLMFVVRFLRQRLLQKFPRHKLADDGTPFGPGQAVATPSIIRGELVAAYGELIELGLVENMELFKEHLIVERNTTDPNRVDILFPPDLINQLRILALLVEFRLQYPAAVAGMAA